MLYQPELTDVKGLSANFTVATSATHTLCSSVETDRDD